MRKYFSYNALLTLMFIGIIAMSCTPGSCFEETNAFMKGTFYSSSSGKAATPDSLTMYGINISSVKLYKKATGVQPAYIPLDASAGSCTYIIRINGIQDTIKVLYTSFPHLISMECGYTFYHTIDSVWYTTNKIVDIIRKNDNVTTLKEENIRIFY